MIRAIKLEAYGQPEQLHLYSDFRRREKQDQASSDAPGGWLPESHLFQSDAAVHPLYHLCDDGREEVVMLRNLGIEL